MRSSNRHPNWWILYVIVALFILVFFLEVKVPLSESARRSLEIAITLLFSGLVWMWLGVNDLAMLQEDVQYERQRKLRLREANASKPAALAGDSAAESPRTPGVKKMVFAWIASIALAIYRFILQ
jgi:energy-coupling factor transporter transmembrane protein EcfT